MRRTTKLGLKALGILGLLLVVVLLEGRFHLSEILDPGRVEERLRRDRSAAAWDTRTMSWADLNQRRKARE